MGDRFSMYLDGIWTVFGRYSNKTDGNSYPVLDLVICHGSFMNAGEEHHFKAYRSAGEPSDEVILRERSREIAEHVQDSIAEDMAESGKEMNDPK